MLVHVNPLALFSSPVLLCLSKFFTIFYYLLQETEHDLQRPRPTGMDNPLRSSSVVVLCYELRFKVPGSAGMASLKFLGHVLGHGY